jgi:hypothetical protein
MKYLLSGVLLLFLLTACAPLERDGGEIRIFGRDDNAPRIATIQNDFLRLDFDTVTAEIIVTDLSGHQWRSTPDMTPEEIQETSAITRFHAQSLFILRHETQNARWDYYDAYRRSVRTERFEHEIKPDGSLEVRFTLGDIPEVFYIPEAIYRERLYTFTDQMERADRNIIMNAYRPYQYSRLRAIDIENGILDRFPMLKPEGDEPEQIIYVLGDVPSHLQERAQNILAAHGYTQDDWIEDMDYFGVERDFDRAVFNVFLRFELIGNEMVVSVPFYEITYNPSFLPVRLILMPFFGAGRPTDDGYLFVPDGSGALLYFDTVRTNQTLFYSNVYGHDEAIVRDHLVHDNRSAFPVFGVYKNGATFAAIIDEGATYAAIRAEVPGMGGPFARVHPSFRLLHGDMADIAGRSDRPILMHENQLDPNERIVVRYIFNLKPGYVGMAEAYRNFLQARYPQLNNRVTQPVTAMVELLGAALTPQHLLGFPVDRPFALTSYSEATVIMETLAAFGWRNVPVMKRGAHNRSLDHSVPTGLNLISQLGSRNEFNEMVQTASRLGYDFYLEGDFMFMRDNRLFNGFSRNSDTVRQITRRRVEHSGFSHVYFGALGTASILSDPVILATPAFTERIIRNFVNEAQNRGVNNIAFRSMASALAGDFNENAHVSREASMNIRTNLLNELNQNGTGIWLNYGFSYAIPYADVITGMPLSDQGFNITDVSVPFYQITLHGLIPFAGRPLNLAEDYSYHLLKTVESGSSLFFSFMDAPTSDLQVSRYLRYFANEFDRWFELADGYYQRHASQFGHLYNQLIIGHEILGVGVTLTVYEDGTRVYVNTSMADFTTPTGVFVPARRYEVRRG